MNMHSNTDFLAKALDASWLRNQLISNNIANVDTPGYKRKDIDFEGYLQTALRANGKLDDVNNIGDISPYVYEDKANLSYRMDDNNVDVDTEMVKLAENQLRYNTLISQVNYNFSRLKLVMNK